MIGPHVLGVAVDAFADALDGGGAGSLSGTDIDARIVALVDAGAPAGPGDAPARALVDELEQQGWGSLWDGLDRAAKHAPPAGGATYLERFRERVDALPGAVGRVHVATLARILLIGGTTFELADLLAAGDFARVLLDVDPNDALLALERLGLQPVAAEATLAMLMATAVDVGARPMPAGLAAMMPASYTVGASSPPPNVNFLMWRGLDAHDRIAEHYAFFHKPPNHTTWFNHHTVDAIVAELAKRFDFDKVKLKGRLGRLKGLKPDILDFSLEHVPWLYEIKPWGSLPVAKFEAELYQFVFNTFNVPVVTGPPGGADTSGWAPAPGGIYVFGCPTDGAIGYHHVLAPKVKLPEGSRAREQREAEEKARSALRSIGFDWEAAALALVVIVALVIIGWVIYLAASAILAAIAAAVAALVAALA